MRITSIVATTVLASTLLAAPVLSLPSGLGGVAPTVRSLPLASAAAAAPTGEALLAGTTEEVLEVQEDSTEPFDLVAVTWDEAGAVGDAPQVEVRVKEDGTWTGWTALEPLEEGPDPGTEEYENARGGTAPLLTDGAEGVEVRLVADDGAPEGAQVELVDAGDLGAGASLEQAPLGAAEAAVGRPTIISRAGWGADESLRRGTASYTGSAGVAVIHHTASTNSYSGQSGAMSQLRSIYAYHTRSLGWADIGYNFLVDKEGRIYEGRAGGVDRPVQGAHSGGFNSGTFGVSALGNYEQTTAPTAMVEGIARLIAWKQSIQYGNTRGTTTLTSAGGGTARFPKGSKVTVNNIIGHRDVGLTACPGANLYGHLATIRQRAAAILGAGLTSPRTDAVSGGIRARAGLLYPGTWKVDVVVGSSVIRSASGSGTSLDWTWDLKDSAGRPASGQGATLRLSSTQNGTTALTWSSATAAVPAVPDGRLDAAVGGTGSVAVSGWALLPGSTSTRTVAVSVNGVDRATLQADEPRPDVQRAFPANSAYHGFAATIPVPAGNALVCARVLESSGSTSIGCRDTTVLGTSPIGSFDAVTSSFGRVTVSGWAVDGDADGPIPVHVWAGGRPIGALPAADFRADVSPRVGGRSVGFHGSLPLALGGTVELCAYGINSGPNGANSLLGCRSVAMPSSPAGSFDAATGFGGTVDVRGWVVDPDADAVAVHTYVDGRKVGDTTATGLRADVSRVHPAFSGRTVAYRHTVPAAGGVRRVCTYGINVGAGGNALLGCRSVSVPTGPPLGRLDGATRTSTSVTVRGWALDPDLKGAVGVHVYVDGRYAGRGSTTLARRDVVNAYPGYDLQRGFQVTVPVSGAKKVCAYAVDDSGRHSSTTLGCRTF